MTARIYGLLAETPLHPGTGQAADIVDLPVAREKATGYPEAPETGIKGALKEFARECVWKDVPANDPNDPGKMKPAAEVERLFGDVGDKGAGKFFPTTARLALLPVRRLDGPYAWVTTPLMLERLDRDLRRIMNSPGITGIPAASTLPAGTILTGSGYPTGQTVFLEEFPFVCKALPETENNIVETLKKLIGDPGAADRLDAQIAIMNDADFAWYAGHALPVAARNVLNDVKISQNLWYEETLAVDTVMWFALVPRIADPDFVTFATTFDNRKYLRIGGNETVGHGWARIARYP